MKPSTHALDFSGVEETALLMLYAKAIESQSENPILKDEKAETLATLLDPILRDRPSKMARQLVNRSIDPRLVVYLSIRAKKYDTYTKYFLEKYPSGSVVNAGCALMRASSGSITGICPFLTWIFPQ